MALISREHGFLFILTPRTGSTAIAHGALIPQTGAEWLPRHDIRANSGRMLAPRKHTTIARLRDAGLLAEEDQRRLFVFHGRPQSVRLPGLAVREDPTEVRPPPGRSAALGERQSSAGAAHADRGGGGLQRVVARQVPGETRPRAGVLPGAVLGGRRPRDPFREPPGGLRQGDGGRRTPRRLGAPP